MISRRRHKILLAALSLAAFDEFPHAAGSTHTLITFLDISHNYSQFRSRHMGPTSDWLIILPERLLTRLPSAFLAPLFTSSNNYDSAWAHTFISAATYHFEAAAAHSPFLTLLLLSRYADILEHALMTRAGRITPDCRRLRLLLLLS
jgi:hypothetical protein